MYLSPTHYFILIENFGRSFWMLLNEKLALAVLVFSPLYETGSLPKN